MSTPAGPASHTARAAKVGATSSAVRRHNLGALLERLHLDGPASRSALGTSTGLNRSTIADLVQELVARGLVVEEGLTSSAGPGRPSPIVHARPEGAVVIAVELAVDSIAVATIGLGGTVLREEHVGLSRTQGSPRRVVAKVAALARGQVEHLPAITVAGVGVAVPGLTRRSDGFVHLAPNLGWKDVPFGTLLADALGDVGAGVKVANEADLGALGEHRRGAGRGQDNVVFVSGGIGIGAGLIIGGEPMLGAAGYAGEAGHMLVNPAGRTCSCGNTGCWETEAGEEALTRSGDATDDVARWLGVGVGNLINLLNPDVVVLGGFYGPLFDRLEPGVLVGIGSRALGQSRAMAGVVPGALGRAAQLHGAAELCLAETLADPTVWQRL